MKKPIKIMILTTGLIILFGAPAIASPSVFQTSEVFSFLTGEATAGAGTLNRDKRSVHLRASMAGLDQNSSYSAWFIVFNNPAACGGGSGICTEPDLAVEEVNGGVINAGGFVTGSDGTGYFVGELKKKDLPDGACCFGELKNGMRAEIHIVIQAHGAHNIGHVGSQISVPGGACNPGCSDQFFLMFPPAEKHHGHDD